MERSGHHRASPMLYRTKWECRLLLGLLSTDNSVPRACIKPSQNRLLNQSLWQAVIINAAISMQRLGMFTGCNSWLNKEGIFGRPCGMGHCFAERWNEIRALTLHQTLFALHDWKGPGWQHKAARLQTPPCNTITSSIASQLLNHLYWLCLSAARSCPASQGHVQAPNETPTPLPTCRKDCPSSRGGYIGVCIHWQPDINSLLAF